MAASMAAAWTNLAREQVCCELARFRRRTLRRCKADGCDQGGAWREPVVAARSGGAGAGGGGALEVEMGGKVVPRPVVRVFFFSFFSVPHTAELT